MQTGDADSGGRLALELRVFVTTASAMLGLLIGIGVPASPAHAAPSPSAHNAVVQASTTNFAPFPMQGAPSTAVTANGTQLLFWEGSQDHHLFENWYADGWQQNVVDVSQSFLNNAVLTSKPSVAVTPGGAQIVFWRGAGGDLIEAWWDISGWHGPVDWTVAQFGVTNFGGGTPPPLTLSPTVAVTPDGTQLVFWRGPGNGLYEAYYTVGASGDRWNGPVNIDGAAATLASSPSAAVTPNGTQVVYWQTATGHLDQAQYNGGGWSLTDVTAAHLGGAQPLTSAPSVAATPDNRQAVFWQGAGGHLTEAWFDSTGWNGPVNVSAAYFGGPPPLDSAPAAAVTAGGVQIVFWQNAVGAPDEAWFSGSWHGPVQY